MANLFNLLTENQKRSLIRSFINKDSTIFYENEQCNCIGILLAGKLKISSYLEDGKEIIFNIVEENGIFGGNLVFSSDKRYKGNVTTLENSEIVFIETQKLLSLFKENENFLLGFLNLQSDFAKSLNDKIKCLSLSSPEERLFYFLNVNDKKYQYKSITSLCEILGIRRETLSRLINKLILENKIKLNKKFKIIKLI